MSGDLTVVRRNGDLYEMDFPAYDLKPLKITGEMIAAIGAEPVEAYMGRDLLCVFDSQETVMTLNPDLEKLKSLDGAAFFRLPDLKDTAASGLCRLRIPLLSQAECTGRSRMRFRALPHSPLLGRPPGQRQHNRLSGIPAGRHSPTAAWKAAG